MAGYATPEFQRHSTQTAGSQRNATTQGAIEDVYIAVMGVTGSGKSSFVELCTQMNCGIGHTLKSGTNLDPGDFII